MIQNRSKCSLLEVSQFKDALSDRILRGAFDVKDLQTQTKLDFEHLLGNNYLTVKAKNDTHIAVSILKQLTQDIHLSIDLFKLDDWDTFILQDALKLLRYTLDNLFGGGDEKSGKAKGLGVAYKFCKETSLKKYPQAAKYLAVATAFDEARMEAIKAYGDLLKHLKLDGDDFTKVSPDDKISTATFFELLVRNEVQKIVETEYECTKSKLLAIICRFYSSREEVGKRFKGADSAKWSWHPATIAIIRDKATGLVFTGATKAQGVEIPQLEKAAYNITVMRLGKKFREEIDKCNENFRDRIQYLDTGNGHPPDWFRKLTDSSTTIQQDLHKIPIFQASTNTDTGSSSQVVSLAMDTELLEIKRPCTRCQCIYYSWDLIERPITDNDRWKLHKKELNGTQFRRAPYGFNYCAETVATAQLVSLHTGNVISDVQE